MLRISRATYTASYGLLHSDNRCGEDSDLLLSSVPAHNVQLSNFLLVLGVMDTDPALSVCCGNGYSNWQDTSAHNLATDLTDSLCLACHEEGTLT